MDDTDHRIAGLLQINGRRSSAEIAEAVGLSVSSANERVRRLSGLGIIKAWRAVLDAERVGAGLCGFVLIDMSFEGEEEAKRAIAACPEVQELHHISGAHSYLMKFRVADTGKLQAFLQERIKPLKAVERTETLIVLETVKETSEVLIAEPAGRKA